MRLLIVFSLSFLLFVGLFPETSDAVCTNTCVSPDKVKNTPEFRAARTKLAKCLFKKTDKNKDGKITQSEYDSMIDDTLGKWSLVRNTLALWSMASSVCNCNCNDHPKVTIDWEDIEGTEPKCLSTMLIIQQASSRLGC